MLSQVEHENYFMTSRPMWSDQPGHTQEIFHRTIGGITFELKSYCDGV